MFKCVIGIDTSGNTGKTLGTTGIAIIHSANPLFPRFKFEKANNNETELQYFTRIIKLLDHIYLEYNSNIPNNLVFIVAVEKYIEYHNKALRFKTSPTIKLNTIIENWCIAKKDVIYREKTANHAKNRWNDKVLKLEGYGNSTEFKKRKTKPNKDMIDALRHALDAYFFQKVEGV